MEQIFVYLYPVVTVGSLAGYLPQIIKLARANSADDKIALQSWLTWIGTYVISLGYGVFHLKDTMFVATTCISMVSMIVVVCLVLYNRHVRFAKPIANAEPEAAE